MCVYVCLRWTDYLCSDHRGSHSYCDSEDGNPGDSGVVFPSPHSAEHDETLNVFADLHQLDIAMWTGNRQEAVPSVLALGCYFMTGKFIFLEVVKRDMRLLIFAGL